MTGRLAVLMTLACVGIVAALGCGRNQEAVATRVVTDWVTDGAEPVADEIAQLLIDEFPDLTRISEDQIVHKIRDAYSWSFKVPECGSNIRCDVTATASVIFGVNLPMLGNRTYIASLPSTLLVDTHARTVLRWTPHPLDAYLEEQPR